jgi:hypothetical protein
MTGVIENPGDLEAFRIPEMPPMFFLFRFYLLAYFP